MTTLVPSNSDEDPRLVFETHTGIEQFWVDRQDLFHSHGYTLRPRYRPGWIPSWRLDPTLDIFDAEDHVTWPMFRINVLDARRLSDNRLVLIKRVVANSEEVRIATYFSGQAVRGDPQNHCVPVLDVIVDREDPTISFLVMPFLRNIDDPHFDSIGSLLECAEQLLEGLVFMHDHNVAHRDCAYKNVMMDATNLYPLGFHPMSDDRLPDDIHTYAPTVSRSNTSVTYYFTDFGISTMFDKEATTKLVTGIDGLDEDVPELSREVPYDPFKTDIFILGNMFGKTFVSKFANVDMLIPLVSWMTARDPSKRPSAAEALKLLREIREEVWAIQRLWRPRPRDEPLVHTAVWDTVSWVSTAYRAIF